MIVNKAVQLAVLTAAVLWETRTDAATSAAVKLCGRKLSEIMSRVCHAYNSPSWDDPAVVEQPAAVVRRKRQVGIADECCTNGCTWKQLNEYCAISTNSESPLDALETHMIADRSAEEGSTGSAAAVPAITGREHVAQRDAARGVQRTLERGARGGRREVGRSRSGGYGHGRARARGRRCWCRRKRRTGRRRSSFMGNTGLIRNVIRAAPVVGTVSPLLTWGRTLNTDLPPIERDRYAYVVYT